MPTSQELHTLLAELQERHPLKDQTPITLLFGGWGFASTDLKDRSIVIPRSWVKDDAWSYFTIIHEYAHLLSEDRVSKNQKRIRRIHNFLAHDKTFKNTETELMAEYGIRLKRWIIYPRTIETPWGNPTQFDFLDFSDILMWALGLNFWGLVIAVVYLMIQRMDISNSMLTFACGLAILSLLDEASSSTMQTWVRRKYRKTGIHRSL